MIPPLAHLAYLGAPTLPAPGITATGTFVDGLAPPPPCVATVTTVAPTAPTTTTISHLGTRPGPRRCARCDDVGLVDGCLTRLALMRSLHANLIAAGCMVGTQDTS